MKTKGTQYIRTNPKTVHYTGGEKKGKGSADLHPECSLPLNEAQTDSLRWPTQTPAKHHTYITIKASAAENTTDTAGPLDPEALENTNFILFQ